MKSILNDKENSVVQLLSQDLSVCKVAAQVGVSIATVSHVMKKHDLDHMAKPGRPQILSDTDKRKILRDITSGNCDTTKQVSATLA
jgi:transposase